MKHYFFIICVLFLLLSCSNDSDNVKTFDKELFSSFVFEENSEAIEKQITNFFHNSKSSQKEIFNKIIAELNGVIGINICFECYECVETNPAKSIINLSLTKDDILYSVNIIIQTEVNSQKLYIKTDIVKGVSCESVNFDINLFSENVMENKLELVETQIKEFIFQFYDRAGYEKGFDKLIQDISLYDNIRFCDACYKCIETNPEQSVITISFKKENVILRIIISESIPKGNSLFIECDKSEGICVNNLE